MTKTYQIIEKDLELFDDYSSSAGSPALSSDMFTSYPEFNFELIEPNIVVRKLNIIDVDPSESWFLESDWLEGEREVNDDIQKGRYLEFENPNDVISFLRSRR